MRIEDLTGQAWRTGQVLEVLGHLTVGLEGQDTLDDPCVLVAVDDDDRLVGFLTATLDASYAEDIADLVPQGRRAFVRHIAVLEQARRQGVGRRLLDEIVTRAVQEGCVCVGLVADSSDGLQAYRVKFFESVSFVELPLGEPPVLVRLL